jgi:hypothetical protein
MHANLHPALCHVQPPAERALAGLQLVAVITWVTRGHGNAMLALPYGAKGDYRHGVEVSCRCTYSLPCLCKYVSTPQMRR